MKYLLLLLFAFAFSLSLSAQSSFPAQQYVDFRGNIDEKYPIAMSLHFDGEDQLRGAYYYLKYGKRIELAGIIKKNGEVVMAESNAEGEKNGEFRGKMKADGEEWVFSGNWKNTEGSKKLKFQVKGRTMGIGPDELGHRYRNAGTELSDAEVEQYVYDLREAIRVGDEETVWDLSGGNIRVNKSVDGEVTQFYLDNQADFEDRYSEVFNSEVLDRVKKAEPFQLFANSEGIMLGSGVIWLRPDGNRIRLYVVNQ